MHRTLPWLAILGLFCTTIWALGTASQNYLLIMLGATPMVFLLISASMILAALPFAIALHGLSVRSSKHETQQRAATANARLLNRREFLRTTAAALPAFSIISGSLGMAKSFEAIRLPVFNFKFPALPPVLSGLKIWHLADLHLGYFRGLRDMERLFERATAHRPDLVLVTGDIADDLILLPGILRMLAELNPPLGVYASLGNHEYYRGIKTVRKHFEASAVPLLCETGITLPVKESSLFIGGTDDPSRSRRSDMKTFFPQSVETTLFHAPADAFKILMSHRPTAFFTAAELGINLTLAGHTHGMQIGYNGRSLFERISGEEKFLWGHYQSGASQLYTTSGVGHWFPFRLGCPPEAPMIVLERS